MNFFQDSNGQASKSPTPLQDDEEEQEADGSNGMPGQMIVGLHILVSCTSSSIAHMIQAIFSIYFDYGQYLFSRNIF